MASGQDGGPWRERCHQGRGAVLGASVGIGSASAAIRTRTSAGIVIEAQEVEE